MKLSSKYLLVLSIWPIFLWADTKDNTVDQWLLCPEISSSPHKYIAPESFPAQSKDETRISAEEVQNAAGDITIFNGNVLIERDQLRLRADHATFNKTMQKLEIDGNVHIDSIDMAIDSDKGWLDLNNNTGKFNNSIYTSPSSHLQGKTPTLTIASEKETILIDSRFSSCPQGNEDWHLDTAFLKLDQVEEEGTAKHAVLWFKNVPIFYSPYIKFPLGDKRRSGFLFPTLGTSGARGFEISVPWYWNIAPNQDAILTPRYMRDRGHQLNTNYRYLTHSSEGQLDIEYLADDEKLNIDRHLVKFNNDTSFTDHLSLNLNASDASDEDYLNDLGSSIAVSNTTHLERTATLTYSNEPWTVTTLAQTYETIDKTIAQTSRPYRRLPQIQANASDNFSDSDLEWTLSTEWVEFDHEKSDQKTTGSRFDFYPKLNWPLQGSAWFFTPSVGVRHTQYDLTDSSGAKINIDDRSLTISSLDTGLFFERDINNNYIQTLEPRLYFLHVPFEDQTAIPIFDTSEFDFTFESLFRDSRFSGADRVGDTEQVTLAITSRFLNTDTGKELLSLNIGQIYYGEDRRVSLDNIDKTESKSDIISEISGQWRDWTTRATVQWNPDRKEVDKRNLQIHYKNDDQEIFNIGYRYRRDLNDETQSLEQTDISLSWPITNRYTLLGRWNYSITEKKDIDTIAGIEYNSCCWAMRLVSQRFIREDSNNKDFHDTTIMFQLILKGFGSVTDKETTNTLKNAILGYQSEY